MTKEETSKGFMRVTVQIGERRFDEDLSAQLLLAPGLGEINRALETGAARQGEWAMLAAFAETERDEIKGNIGVIETQIKDREAEAYLNVINAPVGPKPTVDAIKAMVQLEPGRLALVARKQELEVQLRAANDRLRILEVGVDTLKARKDYVIERARNMREEMQSKMGVSVPAGESLDKFRPGGR